MKKDTKIFYISIPSFVCSIDAMMFVIHFFVSFPHSKSDHPQPFPAMVTTKASPLHKGINGIQLLIVLSLLQLGSQLLVHSPQFLTIAGSTSTNSALLHEATPPNDSPAKRDLDVCRNLGMTADQLCAPWEVDMDSWWTHHPEWDVSFENDACFCFTKMANNTPKYNFLREVYNLQFSETTDCSKVYSKTMFNSGWGVDTEMLADRLLFAYQQKRPFQLIANEPWKYAISPTDEKEVKVCPSANMFCYFLPLGRCAAGRNYVNPKGRFARDSQRTTPTQRLHLSWLRIHATRPQQWFRKRLYDYMKKNAPRKVQTPCVAMHVRRSDVSKFKIQARKYFAISEYIQKVPSLQSKNVTNILLFTDDANAIDEALEFHPEYNWMYVNRTRYRGTEGPLGMHLPTKDPLTEVLAIHAVLRLAKHCGTLVHSFSSFSKAIYDHMAWKQRNITKIQIISTSKRYNKANIDSPMLLQSKLDELRKNKNQKTSIKA